jgi:hypothetical protein
MHQHNNTTDRKHCFFLFIFILLCKCQLVGGAALQNSASAARHLMPLSFVAVLKKRIVAHVCPHQTLKEGYHWHVLRQHHAHSWINGHAHFWINGAVFTSIQWPRCRAAAQT